MHKKQGGGLAAPQFPIFHEITTTGLGHVVTISKAANNGSLPDIL